MDDLWYTREGDRVPLEEWVRLSEEAQAAGYEYRRVGQDVVGEYRISTVLLGIDHSWGGKGPPLIFETMVFSTIDRTVDFFGREHTVNDAYDQFTERYTTVDEAQRGHELITENIRQLVNSIQPLNEEER